MKKKSNKVLITATVALALVLSTGTIYNAVVNNNQQKEIDALQATRDAAAEKIYSQTKEYLTDYVDSDSYVKALQSNESFTSAVESASATLLTEAQIEAIVEAVTESAKEMLLNDDILEGTTSLKAYDLQYVKELIKDEVTSNIGTEIETLAGDCITQADINDLMNKLYARLDDQMEEVMSVDINNLIVQELQSLTSGMVLTQAEKDAFMQDIENTVYNELLAMGVGGDGTVTTLSLTNAQVKTLVNQLTEKVSKPVKGTDYLTEDEVDKMTDTIAAIVESNVLASLRSDSTDSLDTIKSDLNKIQTEIDDLDEILADIQNGDLDVYLADGTITNIADLDTAINKTLDEAEQIKADQEALEKNIQSLTDGDVIGKLNSIEQIGGSMLPSNVQVPGKYGNTNLEASLNWLDERLELADFSIDASQVTYNTTNVESALNDYLHNSKQLQKDLFDINSNLGLVTDADKDLPINDLLGKLNENISDANGNGTVVNTKDATATADKILKNETAYVDGEKIIGTMPNNGSISKTLNAGATYTIPMGYHDGTGKITVTNSSTTAAAADILTGKSVTINGTTTNGTMKNNGSVSKTLNAGGSYTIPQGYHDGTGKITVTNSSLNAAAADILTGKSVTINGTTTNGSMANLPGAVAAGTVSQSGTNARIFLNGTGKITANTSYVDVPVETLKNNVSSLNSSYKIIGLWSNSNASMSQTITAKASGVIFVFLSNRADGNLSNNVNINSQFIVKKNGIPISLTLIDDNMTQVNDGAGTRTALAVLTVNAGDSIYLSSSVWAAFNYANRCYLSVPIDFQYT